MPTESRTAILRLPTTMSRTGIPRSSIYRLISEGKFPRPIKLGVRSMGFIESEIDAWIDARIQATRNAPPVDRGQSRKTGRITRGRRRGAAA